MKKYTVVDRPFFSKGGILMLTKEQAKPRMHLLKHIKGDHYEVTGEVCFKVGEELGIDGPVSKCQTNLEKIGAKALRTEKPETIAIDEAKGE